MARASRARFLWVLIAVLFVLNVVQAIFLAKYHFYDEVISRTESYAWSTMSGSMMATSDFKKGRLRLYRLTDGSDIKSTGEFDGPFEIWTWTYVPDVPYSRDNAESFVSAYNRRMRHLHRQKEDNKKPQAK
jgi:hypothetical protein